MSTYPDSISALVAEDRVFINQNSHSALVLHKTASGGTAQEIAQFFATDPNKASVHYVVGQDGAIVQCVLEKDGAGGNCCISKGYDTFWDPFLKQYGNLNLCTLSIEHVDPATDNSTPLTPAQQKASFELVKYLVTKYSIPTTHVKGHFSIDPINRSRCPGNYPWNELMQYLTGGTIVSGATFSDSEKRLWGMIENVPLNETAGIAQSWLGALRRTHYFGPALCNEWTDGNFMCQAFSCGFARWDKTTGITHWFTQVGEFRF